MLSFEDIKNSEIIKTYIRKADESLVALGFTEHSFAHVGLVAHNCRMILSKLGYSEREQEIGCIASYLHDIGNLVNRVEHSQSGAIMAFHILNDMKMAPSEIAEIITAIGNHDEGTGRPVSPIAAALIIADKSDVRRSRVRNRDESRFDIHDRVNYSVRESRLTISEDRKTISLVLTVDTNYSSVMDYFEIFMQRMIMCRNAASALGMAFRLVINNQSLI